MNNDQDTLIPTWFGRTFKTTLLLIFFIEFLSFFTHWINTFLQIDKIVFVVLSLLVLCLSIYRLQYGIYAALIELLIGSQGHYFDLVINGQTISMRMAIFAIVLISFLYHILRQKTLLRYLISFFRNKTLLLLGFVCIWGLISAKINGNTLGNIFNDFNAWLYFLYLLPIIYVLRDKKHLTTVWPLLLAGITAVSLKSIFFLYVFSHKFNHLTDYLYDWGRDTRWGEFTLVSGGLFRIFSQAQVFALIGTMLLLGSLLFSDKFKLNKKVWWSFAVLTALNISTVLLSLSRSFWVGLLAAGVVMLLFAIFYYRFKFTEILGLVGRSLVVFFLSLIVLIIILFFPIPQQTVLNPSLALNSRFDIQDQAGASRWNQLPHLFKSIVKHPILGSGWGATITYESRDPRITSINNPTGIYTTYAFEWGYLDIILKIGLLGLFIYAALVYKIMRQLFILLKNKEAHSQNVLLVGLFLGLIALVATHVFSPYLNHPLGIGYLVLVMATIECINYSNTVPIKS